MQLHVRGHELQCREVKAADGTAVHECAGVRLQVADHCGAASKETQTHFALVGFLSSVDAQVVGELPRVGEAFTAEATAVPFPTNPYSPRSPILSSTAVGQDP